MSDLTKLAVGVGAGVTLAGVALTALWVIARAIWGALR